MKFMGASYMKSVKENPAGSLKQSQARTAVKGPG
jgi:hypothetical protein